MNGKVTALYICPIAGGLMQQVQQIEAVSGAGLKGDRYATGNGSFNKFCQGRRQVTLINGIFFKGTGFKPADSRRNIITIGVELMWLIGREFQIGTALFRGVKYCGPCNRPSNLSRNMKSFMKEFYDRGGLIAEIIEGGFIKIGDSVIPPPKGY